MDREVNLLIKNIEDLKTTQKASMTFYSGFLSGSEIVVVKSGVGKVNAAACTQALIDTFKPTAILCIGVAGALREELSINDTVVSKDVIQHDVDSSCFGYEVGEISNMGIKSFKGSTKLINIAKKVHKKKFNKEKIFVGTILSGDQFICNKEKVTYLRKTFGGYCVEMEGAAIGHVCYLNDVPFLVIRSISDKADGTAVDDYETFVIQTAKKSYKLVEGILRELSIN